MRLHKLRFKNINSLAGEYEINFDAPPYAESGIFAITGPTGSGKSSILDAVALALYGKTPRTESIAEGSKVQEPYFFLSKNRDDCYAQAIFEVRGRFYLSRWSVARKRRGEGFSPAKAELAALASPDDECGRILAEKITDWRDAVKRVLGMDYEAFTRCVLLAQGAFTNFLRAPLKQRSEILERITGTQIYSEIGKAVFRRAREEEAEWRRLEEALLAASPLGDEARQALDASLLSAQAQAEELRKTSEALAAACRWLEEVQAAERERDEAAQSLLAARAAVEAAEPQAKRAAAARRALLPMARVEALRALEKKAEAAEQALWRDAEAAKQAQNDSEAGSKAYRSQVQAQELACRRAEAFRPQATAMAVADAEIKKLREAAREADERFAVAKKEAEKAAAQAQKARRDAAEAAACRSELALTLQKGAADDRIAPLLPGLVQAVEAHRAKKLAALDAQKAAAAAREQEKAAAAAAEEAAAAAREAAKRREAAAAAAAEARRAHEVAMAGSSIEKALLSLKQAEDAWWSARWLLQLAEEAGLARAALKGAPADGALAAYASGVVKRCGAAADALLKDFPEFAHGVTPERAAELKAAADSIRDWSKRAGISEASLRGAEAAQRRADEASSRAAAAELRAKAALAPLASELAAAEARQKACDDALDEARADYLKQAGAFVDASVLMQMKPAEVLRQLEARADARAKALAASAAAEERAALCAQSAAAAEARLEGAQTALAASEGAARSARQDAEAAESRRRQAWGDQNGQAALQALEAAALQAQKAASEAASRASSLREKSAAAAEAAKKSREAAEAARAEAAAEAPKTVQALREAGFDSAAALEEAYLPEDAILRFEAAQRTARERLAAAEALEKKRAEALAAVLARRATNDAPQEARAKAKAASERLLAANQAIGRLSEQQRADDERRAEAAEMRREADSAKKCYEAWGELSGLIGSATGDVFRRAAQKLTFRVLLAHANRVLDQMQSRYELKPAGEEGLDVDVADRFLMGMSRTSFNLSGGETFLVSLALALSLSRITTRGLQVDTLFLDEGFGALDAETLDRALAALESLQQNSRKLVGIISHVQAVRDRIATHIAVRPRSQGESEVTGPGVRRL